MAKEQSDADKEWMQSVRMLLGSIDHKDVQACSISVVPDQLKNSNEDAYMPKNVSMGPLYRGTRRDLLRMEEIKLRCMLSLLHRTTRDPTAILENLDKCSLAILNVDKLVRASYVDHIQLDNHELAKIMLVDGCFLLELLITASEELNDRELVSCLISPSPGAEIGKKEEVLSDLIMLENQIPFLILDTLTKNLFPEKGNLININNLGLSLFGCSPAASTNFAHILELVHSSIPWIEAKKSDDKQIEQSNKAPPLSNNGQSKKADHESQHTSITVFDQRCATRLQTVGVTIKPRFGELDNPLSEDSKFVQRLFNVLGNIFGRMLIIFGLSVLLRKLGIAKKPANKNKDNPAVLAATNFDFDMRFNHGNGKLEIPQLHITKTTKAKWRNFIAWEHHKNQWNYGNGTLNSCNSKFTSSALFFNGLISSTLDVQLLKDKKVIVDHLKMSNKEMVTFFRTMAKGVDQGIIDSSYVNMAGKLNSYSGANFAIQMAKEVGYFVKRLLLWLKKFFKHYYRAALSLGLILTLVQTVYAVLAYQHPNA